MVSCIRCSESSASESSMQSEWRVCWRQRWMSTWSVPLHISLLRTQRQMRYAPCNDTEISHTQLDDIKNSSQTFVPHLHYQRSKTCSRHLFWRSYFSDYLFRRVWAENIVRHPCSDYNHVTAPYKMSFIIIISMKGAHSDVILALNITCVAYYSASEMTNLVLC